jgi:DNA (cytosine-5)-methyltransferase 1
MFNTISLFSGIGGIEKGIERWCSVQKFVEIDKACQNVLQSCFPEIPIEDNVKNIKKVSKTIVMLSGGFPCQDISHAGKGKGLEGKRSGLVYEIFRILESNPHIQFCFLENVQMLLKRGMDVVIAEFNTLGYNIFWCTLEATEIGALHKRKRVFIFAIKNKPDPINLCDDTVPADQFSQNIWLTEPDIDRVLTEKPTKETKQRIKMLGNSVVPQQARKAFQILFQKASEKYRGTKVSNIPQNGFKLVNNPNIYSFSRKIENKTIFPETIQRFKETHTLPTPTASDAIYRKPTNTVLSSAFRPGVNKSVTLNRYIQMFPSKTSKIPEITDQGYLANENIVVKSKYSLNPNWVEWLMGFDTNWTFVNHIKV